MTLLRFGLIGLPNVGKSTIFNRLVQQELAQASNFPFCTIEPNIATVPVLDTKVEELGTISKSKNIVFSKLQCIDIAGLVKGASNNVGLGNQFLENIRQVDLMLQVVRLFEDTNIQHVHDKIDPISDIDLINTELILTDIDMCGKLLNHKKSTLLYTKTQREAVTKALKFLESGHLLSKYYDSFSQDELKFLKHKLLTIKPMVYLANGEPDDKFRSLQEQMGEDLLLFDPFDGDIHILLAQCYKKLDLISFYTTGPDESRSWSIMRGTKARKAAGEIHSDFEEKFIRALVISYEDFIGGARNYRVEGSDYIVQDSDICEFKVGR